MEHHGAALRALTKDDTLVKALKENPASATMDARGKALVAFALKLTKAPSAMAETDVAALREAGLTDRAVLDLVHVVAYFNFVNRLAEGLGVELEEAYRASSGKTGGGGE
jgi:uncharacterized peroxidase-related enzyme